MRKFLYNNTLLKIMSVIMAIIIWAYIIVIIDAPTEKTFRDVPIQTINEQVLSDNGYSIEKLSVQSATARIEGSRKIISKFNSSNITAKLDFSEVNAAKLTDEGIVTVNLSVVSEFGDVVSFTPSAVDVFVESTKYKDVDIKYTNSGELLEGYKSGDFSLSQSRIRIFGAQSSIDEVSYASVNVDLINTKFDAYKQGEMSQDCTVKLYKNDGKELSEKEMRWVWNNSPSITVTCPIYKVKTVRVIPNPDSTMSGVKLKVSPETIKIYGDNEDIEDYDEINTKIITKNDFGTGTDAKVQLSLPGWAKVVNDVTEVKVSEDNG